MTLTDPTSTRRMSELPDDRLFGKPELAAYLGLSVSGVTKLLDDGRGPAALRVGRLVRFRRSDVMAWLEVQRFHFGMRAKL